MSRCWPRPGATRPTGGADRRLICVKGGGGVTAQGCRSVGERPPEVGHTGRIRCSAAAGRYEGYWQAFWSCRPSSVPRPSAIPIPTGPRHRRRARRPTTRLPARQAAAPMPRPPKTATVPGISAPTGIAVPTRGASRCMAACRPASRPYPTARASRPTVRRSSTVSTEPNPRRACARRDRGPDDSGPAAAGRIASTCTSINRAARRPARRAQWRQP